MPEAVLAELATIGRRPSILVNVAAACIALTWSAVILRVYVRVWMIRSFGWDDATIVIAQFSFTGLCSCLIIYARLVMSNTLQYNGSDISADLDFIEKLIRILLAFIAFFVMVVVIVRISLAVFFLRVTTIKWQRQVIYVTAILSAMYSIAFSIVVIFECGRPDNFLQGEIQGTCLPNHVLQPMYYTAAAMNAFSDWLFVFFPLHLLWKARMPIAAKFSASVLLVLGALGSVAALIKIAYIPYVKAGPHFVSRAIEMQIWTIVEPGVYISAVSLATLRPLFSSLLYKWDAFGYYNVYSYYGSKSRINASDREAGASRHDILDENNAQFHVQDAESTITFETESHSLKRLTNISEVSYDSNLEGTSAENRPQRSHSWPLPHFPAQVHKLPRESKYL